MKLGNGNHLMCCLDAHPCQTRDEIEAVVMERAAAIKAAVCPYRPLALGLQVNHAAARQLLGAVDAFRTFLAEGGFYCVSFNGFSYASIGNERAKEDTYVPDWASPERAGYTLDLARLLAGILPEGEVGTISTLASHYGKREKREAMDNLAAMTRGLATVEKESGRRIILALEPEPDCFLDSEASTFSFFQSLFQRSGQARRYIGVCLDCCHAAVAFESPLEWHRAFSTAGIAVPKIQLSASLRIKVSQDRRELLKPFFDERYLLQTRVLAKGKLRKYRDLPDAMSHAPDGEWRVHLHVPLTWEATPIDSTSDLLNRRFFREVLSAGSKHLQLATFSPVVLAADGPATVDTIVSELQWLRGRLS